MSFFPGADTLADFDVARRIDFRREMRDELLHQRQKKRTHRHVAPVRIARGCAEHHAALAAVLLDLKMPRMGGSQAFSAMHAIDANIPILICTGYGDNEEVQQLIQEGAMGLLAKPFTLKDFSDALAKLRA